MKTPTKKEAQETKDEYRQRVMNLICSLMAEGQSLRRICKSVEGMPNHSTVMDWVREDEALANRYARAREQMTDYRFEEFRDAAAAIVAKYMAEGWEPKDAVQMARLECGNMQWELSKLAPKKYGDKIEQTLQNPDGTPLDLIVNFVTTPKHNG